MPRKGIGGSCPLCHGDGCVACADSNAVIGKSYGRSIPDFDIDVSDMVDVSIADRTRTAADRRAVAIFSRDAGHEFECDGYDRDVFDDAVYAVESASYTDCIWVVGEAVIDAIRAWYDDRTVDADDVGIIEPGVVHKYTVVSSKHVDDRDAFLIGKRAVGEPPVGMYTSPVVVRDPEGVAVVRI